VETDRQVEGCQRCGVLAGPHGRREHLLHVAPFGHRRVRVAWHKWVWRCLEPACPTVTFTEVHAVARPRALLTRWAVLWAADVLADDDTTVNALARRIGVDWHTLWAALRVEAHRRADDPDRLQAVESLGVDEHIWRPGRFGAGREVTCMVDLTRDANGQVRARLLDLVLGRSGPAYAGWFDARQPEFRANIKSAALDPFRGYANALRDSLANAVQVLDVPRRQARHPGRRRGPPSRAAGAARPPRAPERPALQDPRSAPARSGAIVRTPAHPAAGWSERR